MAVDYALIEQKGVQRGYKTYFKKYGLVAYFCCFNIDGSGARLG